MVAKIVPFLFRAPRSNDWTQEEIAEFYRIEHALVQARLQVETDRGLSDEGEPWFAFCRGDGEVLVHIARDGGGYLMHASGLQAPVRARRLVDLARSFVDQFRVGAALEQATTGSTLLIHPVAMLAMVICAIFAANEDGVSLGASVAPAEANNGQQQPNAPGGAVALYQSFEKVLAAAMGQAAALEAHKDSIYLTIVCSIVAAIGVAAPIPEEVAGSSVVTHAAEAVEGHDVAAAHDFTDGESALAFDATPLHVTVAWSVAVSDLLQAPSDDTIVAMPSLLPAGVVAASFVDNRPMLTDDALSIRIDEWRPEPGSTPQPVVVTHAGADQAMSSGGASSTAAVRIEPVTASLKPVSTAGEDFSGNNKVDQLLQLLFKGQPTATDFHGGGELVQAPPGIALALSQILSDQLGPVHVEESRFTYSMFDSAGQKALVDFLKAFPNAPVVFSAQQIVIYDGATDFDTEHLTIRIWELESGQTIALVGHSDHPAAHTGSVA